MEVEETDSTLEDIFETESSSPASPEQIEERDNTEMVEKTDQELAGSSFSEGATTEPCPHHLMTTRELQLYWKEERRHRKPVKLLFEIQSTRIAEDFLSKYVMYKIVIIQTGSFDESKVSIERRYSEFEKLHRNLLKDFKDEMEDIIFPKKVLMGNLTEEMISKRILSLKDYLSELNAIKCIRKSKKYIDFFINPEFEEGYSCLRGGQYGKALEIFQNVVQLQEKLTKHCPVVMVASICALVVCHKDLENSEEAYKMGLKALALIEKHPGHKYYVPLLDTMVTLAYKLGKDFVSLQKKLVDGENIMRSCLEFKIVSLKELVVQECVHK
ncbi:sorting nexin-20 [Discoglossus pictus]